MNKFINIISTFVVLTLIFIVLKSTGIIAWPWATVFSPLLLIFGIALAILGMIFLTFMVFAAIMTKMRKMKG